MHPIYHEILITSCRKKALLKSLSLNLAKANLVLREKLGSRRVSQRGAR